MEPINYKLDVANPFDSVMKGYSAGLGIRDAERNKDLQEQSDATALAAAQREQELQVIRDRFYQKENKTAQDYSEMMLVDPSHTEQYKKSWDVLDPAQKQQKLESVTQIRSALMADRPDLAIAQLKKDAESYRRSGNEKEAQAAETHAELLNNGPEGKQIGLEVTGDMLAAFLGPEKFVDMFKEREAAKKIPSEIAEKEASANKANAEAGKLDAEKSVVKLEAKVKLLEAMAKSADSQTKRDEILLKRDETAQQKQKAENIILETNQQTLNTLDSSLDTIDKAINHPGLWAGSGLGGDFRAYWSGSDAADFRKVLETVKSQQFLTHVKELKNSKSADSNAEGARLERATASLETEQDPDQLKENLKTIQDSLEKGRRAIIGSGKLPTTGGGYVMSIGGKDVFESTINKILMKRPGYSRKQVIATLEKAAAEASAGSQIPE